MYRTANPGVATVRDLEAAVQFPLDLFLPCSYPRIPPAPKPHPGSTINIPPSPGRALTLKRGYDQHLVFVCAHTTHAVASAADGRAQRRFERHCDLNSLDVGNLDQLCLRHTL